MSNKKIEKTKDSIEMPFISWILKIIEMAGEIEEPSSKTLEEMYSSESLFWSIKKIGVVNDDETKKLWSAYCYILSLEDFAKSHNEPIEEVYQWKLIGEAFEKMFFHQVISCVDANYDELFSSPRENGKKQELVIGKGWEVGIRELDISSCL